MVVSFRFALQLVLAAASLGARVAAAQSPRRLDDPAAAVRWTDGGRPTRQAMDAIAVLEGVASRGLEPGDYGAPELRRDAAVLAAAVVPDTASATRFGARLSRVLVRLLAHLHAGRIDPHTIGADLSPPQSRDDYAAAVAAISRAADVDSAITAFEPPYAAYVALRQALIRYRVLATDTTLRPVRPMPRAVRPGETYTDAPALRRLLVAFGDLREQDERGDGASRIYDTTLARAVARFQERHGLAPDGVLGKATLAELGVSLATRVRQIGLAMERWRWLPNPAPARSVIVNVPEFRLFAFDSSLGSDAVLTMKVIVGSATGRHSTPSFTGTMREVVFRPYWDVPLRIARTELLPIIRRRPGYMAAEGMEIVRGGEDDAVVYANSAANLARVADGTFRLRQRPGPKNALGPVKFVFPNEYNVYLHGTPTVRLFERVRRDFSHGCIRTEDPAKLAEFVLRGETEWGRDEIEEAMQGPHTIHVPLTHAIPVFVVYATAVARDDVVAFLPDIYARDAVLTRALGGSRKTSAAVTAIHRQQIGNFADDGVRRFPGPWESSNCASSGRSSLKLDPNGAITPNMPSAR